MSLRAKYAHLIQLHKFLRILHSTALVLHTVCILNLKLLLQIHEFKTHGCQRLFFVLCDLDILYTVLDISHTQF